MSRIRPSQNEQLGALCDELAAFARFSGLELASADEMLQDLSDSPEWHYERAYLQNFIDRWNAAEAMTDATDTAGVNTDAE